MPTLIPEKMGERGKNKGTTNIKEILPRRRPPPPFVLRQNDVCFQIECTYSVLRTGPIHCYRDETKFQALEEFQTTE